MTQLILIRHGETLWNRQGRMQGQQDSPLTEFGEQQARRLGRRLAGIAFDTLYSSDLGRAHQTACRVAEVTGHAITVDERLRERHFGVFEGLTSDELQARYAAEYERFKSRDADYVVPGGESAQQFRARTIECLREIAERHAGGTVAVVTHGLVLDTAYRAAYALAPAAPRPVPLLNASLNIFRYAGGRWHCETWGDVDHLQDESVTRFEGRGV